MFLRKLKPDKNYTMFIIPGTLWTMFFISLILFNIGTALKVLGFGVSIVAVGSLVEYHRTRAFGPMISTIYLFVLASLILSLPVNYLNTGGRLPAWTQLLVLFTLILWVWMMFLVFSRKLKWKGRELFELAAMNVEDVADGYSPRPHPAGKIEATKKQILSFAGFMQKQLWYLVMLKPSRLSWYRSFRVMNTNPCLSRTFITMNQPGSP